MFILDIIRSILVGNKRSLNQTIASKLSSSEKLIGFFFAHYQTSYAPLKILGTWVTIIFLAIYTADFTGCDIEYILPLVYILIFISLVYWCYGPQYYIAVTNEGLHFHKLKWLRNPDTHDFSRYVEIPKISLKKGFFDATFELTFKDNRHLKLNIPVTTMGKRGTDIIIIDKQTEDYLLTKTT